MILGKTDVQSAPFRAKQEPRNRARTSLIFGWRFLSVERHRAASTDVSPWVRGLAVASPWMTICNLIASKGKVTLRVRLRENAAVRSEGPQGWLTELHRVHILETSTVFPDS